MRLHDLFEEQTLLEVNMSPSALRLMASKIDARAGMEFEIIVAGADVGDNDDYEMEPDYDQDETPESIRHVCDFFEHDDWGVGNNVQRLERDLRNTFDQWLEEGKLSEAWAEEEYNRVYEWVVNNADEDEIREHLGYEEGEELGKRDYQAYTEYCIEERNELYEEAEEDFRDDFFNMDLEDLEAEWLNEAGYHSMQDISNDFNNADWPYMQENTNGNGGDDIASIADEFEGIIDRRVRSSSSYHSATRNNTDYIVEPDGSLDADDARDGGLEFVSPPLPVTEMLDDLRKVVAWCKQRGNYTNDSTGLHMNVSVPGYSIDKLDYVKLALFLGDEYVLEQFGRESNTYCKSALQKVRSNIRPENREHVLNRLTTDLSTTASKVIHSGVTDKYTSINTKNNYIEFRSPGGDWLKEDIDKLENTLLRFVVALSIAIDPQSNKQEYAKKLYKLLSPADDGTNTLQLFSDFKAGKIDRESLINNIRSVHIQRKIKKDPTGGEKYWWSVSRPGYFASIEVVATSKEEAIDRALEPGNYPDWASARSMLKARPIRPYDTSPVRASVGEPQPLGQQSARRYRILNHSTQETVDNRTFPTLQSATQYAIEHDYPIGRGYAVEEIPAARSSDPIPGSTLDLQNRRSQTDYENRLGWGDQTGDANYEIVDRRTNRRQMVFIANTDQDALRKFEQWLNVAGLPEDTEDFGFRAL